jgi:hypothetical protein
MYKEKLPYSQTALVLGVSSIVTACCCGGFIGIIVGAIGLTYANKAINLYREHPNDFDGINNAQTGRTMSIIGIVIGVLSIVWMVHLFSSGDYEIMFEEYDSYFDDENQVFSGVKAFIKSQFLFL